MSCVDFISQTKLKNERIWTEIEIDLQNLQFRTSLTIDIVVCCCMSKTSETHKDEKNGLKSQKIAEEATGFIVQQSKGWYSQNILRTVIDAPYLT